LTQSNVPLSTSQIVSHFISQNNKVQIDYLITLARQIERVTFFMPIILGILTKTPSKKTMNCNSDDMGS
jgi:hypothetical protein